MKKTGEVHYPRLEAEISCRGILKKDMLTILKLDHASFSYKLNGERPFTLEQGLLIWKTWFSDIPIDELFRKNETEKGDETP